MQRLVRRGLIGALVLAFSLIGSASAQSAHIMKPWSSRSSTFSPFDERAATSKSAKAVSDLLPHEDSVLPNPHIYALFWGNPKKFPSDYVQGMSDFLGAYGNSAYTDVLTQYMFGGPAPDPTFDVADSFEDKSTKPPGNVSNTRNTIRAVGNEVCALADSLGGPDPEGTYVVMTSNFPSGANYCAWHTRGVCSNAPSIQITFAYLPNLNKVSGCFIGPKAVIPGVTNPYSNGVRSDANAAAHELAETITDPYLVGWYDKRNMEVADKCIGRFKFPVPLNDGFTWQIQELWSNAAGQCVQDE